MHCSECIGALGIHACRRGGVAPRKCNGGYWSVKVKFFFERKDTSAMLRNDPVASGTDPGHAK
jgi:hypothetical protein